MFSKEKTEDDCGRGILDEQFLRYHGAEVNTLGLFFFFQAEDGIRDAQESRGLGDVYKRQDYQGIAV